MIANSEKARVAAFTALDLLVGIGILFLLAALLSPALARTGASSNSFQCLSNTRQLALAWRLYAEDNSGFLVAASALSLPTRPKWLTGNLDYTAASGNWDTNIDMVRSPLWPYTGKQPTLFKCPADQSSVLVGGVRLPRIRSYSLSSAFGAGEWLDKAFNSAQTVWRTYGKIPEIVLPSRTFLFVDEHPDSINDGALNSACTGAQPGDPPSAAQIIDFPAAYHHNGCAVSFADEHAELHRWLGLKIKPAVTYSNYITLNVSAGDSWRDIQWLAQNTTVRR